MPLHSRVNPERRGLVATHVALLFGVATLLTTLTLTRLQLFAVYENERDAVELLEYLGGALSLPATESVDGRFALRHEVERTGITVGNAADSEWLENGRVLRRRGYLFDLVQGPSGTWCLRAWPWQSGTTGVAAYAFTPVDGLLGNPNREQVGAPGDVGSVGGGAVATPWSGLDGVPRGPYLGEPGERALEWFGLEDSRSLGLASRVGTVPLGW